VVTTDLDPSLPDAYDYQVGRSMPEDWHMCLNCGCMRAHDDMGKPGVNITYEDVKRAADANGKTVDETLETIARTSDKDRGDHPAEYQPPS
jgi:hypothetical protein